MPDGKQYNFSQAEPGDVILYDSKEFVWTGGTWRLLGDEGSYAIKGSIKDADIDADAEIQQSKIANLTETFDTKVDKEDGKSLTSNDFTYELKQNNDISFRTLSYLIDNERSYVYVEVAKTYLEIGLQRFIDTIKKSNEMVNDGRDYKERALMYSALIASKSIDHQKKKTKNKKNL